MRSTAALAALSLLLASHVGAEPKKANTKPWHVETGEISFYADMLAGRKTASGEVYDPKQATCAHRTLPFGTVLRVTVGRGKAKRTATCRVNDRGPFAKGRVLDVSSSLARTLGFHRRGHVVATLTSVGPRPTEAAKHKRTKR
jgi:rare lipoprotein A